LSCAAFQRNSVSAEGRFRVWTQGTIRRIAASACGSRGVATRQDAGATPQDRAAICLAFSFRVLKTSYAPDILQ